MKYLPTRLTPAQKRERTNRIRAVLRDHRLGEAMGGTSVGSVCVCSCGERNYSDGTRDMAAMRGRTHVASEIGRALDVVKFP